jgi:FHS family L-fucose permease-like MFS transporter
MKLNPSLLILAAVFFVVGALFCMNDVIFPYVKDYYGLSYFQTTLIQWTFYLVYIPFPFFVSFLLEKYGYKWVVVAALFICISGCLLFYPSYLFSSFGILLGSIFVLSTGIVFLNVGANPYAALLGSSEQSQLRMNFVQFFSRVGYAATPVLGNFLVKPQQSLQNVPNIYLPYFLLAMLFVVILILMFFVKMPSLKPDKEEKISLYKIILKSLSIRHLSFGALAMFFYVGAEACTASFLMNYQMERGQNLDQASFSLMWYNIAAGVASFVGIYILKLFSARKVVAVFSVILIILYVGISLYSDAFSVFGFIGIGIFIAIMFPTIYGLAIQDLGNFTPQGAALVSLAIVGGAVFPPIQGLIADYKGVSFSYLIPAACFVTIFNYVIFFSQPSKNFSNE